MSFLPHTAFSQAFVILTCLVICFPSSSFDALGVDLLGQFQLPEVSSLNDLLLYMHGFPPDLNCIHSVHFCL